MKNKAPYVPHTTDERAEMLRVIGVNSIDALFTDIPEGLRLQSELKLPPAMSEPELLRHMNALAAKNISAATHICFMGGGVYDHFIPAAVSGITSRQEFYTAYTPYQAEMSQGTLQSIFEYQTMICELTGMDLSNASVYDGATACAEAMLMAYNITERTDIVFAGKVNPQYIEVCETYGRFRGVNVIRAPYDPSTGTVSIEALSSLITDNCAAVIAQNPNFFGLIENLKEIGAAAKSKGALFIAVADPISLAILEPPGSFGADIVAGEGQALGNPMSFGGPGFGFLACTSAHMRKIPGRIIGQTNDASGRRGFILTLQAREQHIRREKATSNICSNQALCALAAAAYMSLLGKKGLREVAELCASKSHYMYNELIKTGKFEPVFSAPFFKEFTLRYKGKDLGNFIKEMTRAGFMPGIDLAACGDCDCSDCCREGDCVLIAVTEKRTKAEIDAYVAKAGEIA